MYLNEYFDKIFCINLDRRPDKWALSEAEFKKIGISVERFAAIDGASLTLPSTAKITAAEAGCSLSHLTLLKRMVESGWSRILILEDDVEFMDGANQFFNQWMQQVPTDWDMLYLGGNNVSQPTRISRNVSKIIRTYTTSSYGITNAMAQQVIANVESLSSQVDVAYTNFHRSHKCYIFWPTLAWQKAGFSDIQNAHTDYTHAMKKG